MAVATDPEYGYSEETPILHTDRRRRRNRGSTCWSRFLYGLSCCWNRMWIGIPIRYDFATKACFGFIMAYALRVDLSVSMVAMVGKPRRQEYESYACKELLPAFTNSTSSKITSVHGEFDWDASTQSNVLGAFFVGYVITQLPGGILAERYGGKWLFGGGILITSIFTLLTPVAARQSVYMLMFVRFMEGLGEGVTFPAMNALIGRWCPKMERSRISTLIYTGSPIGTVLALSMTGYISDSSHLGGWPTVFYLFGAAGCVWCLWWMVSTYDSPEEHPRITKEELQYIREGQDGIRIRGAIPWRAIFTSTHVWALVVTHFGFNWGFYTLLTELPTYLSNILHYDLKQNGLFSSLPYVCQAIFAHVASNIADKMRASDRYRITTIRKIMNSIAFFLPGLLVGAVAFVGCLAELIVGLIILSVAFSGFMYSGFNVTHVDMSPEFAGTLMGITNCVANTAGFLAPIFVGWCTKDGQTVRNWGIVFVTTAAIYFVTGAIYNIFASAELEPWGVSQSQPVAVERDQGDCKQSTSQKEEAPSENRPNP